MNSRFAMAAVVLVIAVIAAILMLHRQRRMLAESRQQEIERTMEQDAMRRARAKLKFMSNNRKRSEGEGESGEQDPLQDLFGMEVPTDCRPAANKKSNSGPPSPP